MRIMALDYGDARTGVAISDADGVLTGFTTVLQPRGLNDTVEQAGQLAASHGVERLVVGFPKNMDGTDGSRADVYRLFASELEKKTGLETVLWDERRTTIEAHEILSTGGKKYREHKKTVDAVAASLLLESYLQFLSNRDDSSST